MRHRTYIPGRGTCPDCGIPTSSKGKLCPTCSQRIRRSKEPKRKTYCSDCASEIANHKAKRCRACENANRISMRRASIQKEPMPNPSGLCLCGCGQPAPIATSTIPSKQMIRGLPSRFIAGHQARKTPTQYVIDESSGCWNWQWSTGSKEYGQLRDTGKTKRAHRVFYERAKGPIPKGLVIDHLCRNKRCVNPDHLEAVTQGENCRRGLSCKSK